MTTPLKCVVDASVVVKWVLQDETYQENSAKLKNNFLAGKTELFAPSFMLQETANALWMAIKQKRIQQIDAQEALKVLQNVQLRIVEIDWTGLSKILAIACELDIAVCDAVYIFLCDQIDAQLVTADNKLFEKTKKNFNVLHIRDYS